METISLSPTPAHLANTMSTRRGPLTNNPHAANSPMRGPVALGIYAKHHTKRSYATIQREESYGQPPPTKKQALDGGSHRPVRSPSKLPRSQMMPQRGASTASTTSTTRQHPRDRASTRTTHNSVVTRESKPVKDDSEEHAQIKENWKKHYRAKFPRMVFYFESIPDDIRAKLTRRVTNLGARQEPFFSIDVTHVITTRAIPNERSETSESHQQHVQEEQPQTINPSLLDRNNAARRKLLTEFRNVPSRSQHVNDLAMPNRATRSNDVLHKAREMGKKIWGLDKFQGMVSLLLETDQHQTSTSRTASARSQSGTKANISQMLHNERMNGPSDRDMAASLKELAYFKGPYIHIWDMDEKHKPMMVREYAKVTNKADGDWPQFRSVGNGRCPFVEELDTPQKDARKKREQEEKLRAATVELKAAAPAPVTGKRSLQEMEDAHNRRPVSNPKNDIFNAAKASLSKQATQNAFTSQSKGGPRLFHGEPVASGMQQSNITSAIRSAMISSTSGISGVKAGTSKELHGLQRKVLQKSGASSRLAEQHSVDVASSHRSVGLSRQTPRPVEGIWVDEEGQKVVERKAVPLKSKTDMKPGYCENCQDKFRDFDEHILTRKHRKFAENLDNWTELDDLIKAIKRVPLDSLVEDDGFYIY